MLLTLDMGNTNITIGVFDGSRLLFESRVATDRSRMEDQYAAEFRNIFRLYQVDDRGFEGAVLGSVVPPLDNAIRRAVKKVTGHRPADVGPGTKTGIDIRIDNPAQLGADLLVGAVAAVARYGPPCAVWDLGTATKVSVVDAAGAYRGGAIMPGVGVSMDALWPGPPCCPPSGWKRPPKRWAPTPSTVCSPARCLAPPPMLEGMTARIEEELGYPVKGGGHRWFRPGGGGALPPAASIRR